MTQKDFDRIVESLDALSPEQVRQLRLELDRRAGMSDQSGGPQQKSLGAMGDADDELDRIVEQAMRNRQKRPWRLPPGE